MTTRATARPHCLLRSMWPPERSSGSFIGGIAQKSSLPSYGLTRFSIALQDSVNVLRTQDTSEGPRHRVRRANPPPSPSNGAGVSETMTPASDPRAPPEMSLRNASFLSATAGEGDKHRALRLLASASCRPGHECCALLEYQ
jgi:hypothetical protein